MENIVSNGCNLAGHVSFANLDCTHFEREHSQKIDRAAFFRDWKYALTDVFHNMNLGSKQEFSLLCGLKCNQKHRFAQKMPDYMGEM